jgi:hypothetical protein
MIDIGHRETVCLWKLELPILPRDEVLTSAELVDVVNKEKEITDYGISCLNRNRPARTRS